MCTEEPGALRSPLSGPRFDVLQVVHGTVAKRIDLDRIDIREVLDLQFTPHFGIRMWQVARATATSQQASETLNLNVATRNRRMPATAHNDKDQTRGE